MRPGQNKRMRGRPNNNGGSGGHRKGPNPLTRSYESNGPDVKIRGNAHHVAEKYLQLARDAQSSGDPVSAESYLQHAEHYFRLIASAQQAQAGYSRLPDAVDTEMDEDDESGVPDRFASPQAPAPFVPQPAPQPYPAERQPYGGEQRQPYQDRQGNGGERQPYNDRQANGERPHYGDRNNFDRPQRQDRQDRNGLNRRPYRDNLAGDARTDDRGGERQFQDRNGQDRNGQDRNGQDRQGRRERFAQDRSGQEHGTQDRGYDRQDRGQGERYRDAPAEPPRVEAGERQPASETASPPHAALASQPEVTPQPVSRAEPAPRPEPTSQPSDDAPGLPSFITTPTRVAASDPAAPAEPNLATNTVFPGDGAQEVPKFPRRRRRAAPAAAVGPGEDPATGD